MSVNDLLLFFIFLTELLSSASVCRSPCTTTTTTAVYQVDELSTKGYQTLLEEKEKAEGRSAERGKFLSAC